MKIFLDSNVFGYSFDYRYPDKRQKARSLLQALKTGSDVPVISTQVMQEVYNIPTRKLSVTPADAAAELQILALLETVIMTPALILSATGLHASASLSFWDSLIVTAALERQCTELWTEDMQDGQKFGALEIVNPFQRR